MGLGVCESCGSWGEYAPPAENSLKYVYDPVYWTTTQARAGCPAVETRFEADMLDRIAPYLNALLPHLSPGAKVAETGCGNARLLHELKARGFDILGLNFRRS